MELLEEVGNEGTIPPEQMLKVVPKVKVGVVCGVIVTVNVIVIAHCPASGVKVYVPLFALSTIAGDHEPVIELLEEVGNEGTMPPEQMLKVVPKVKVGVVCRVIVTVNVIVIAHCPTSGVKVYVPLFALSTIAGDHVPVIELLEEVGNEGTIPPAQILKVAPKVKVGVVCGVIVTVNVVVVAHCPASGVKVYVPLFALSTIAGDHVPVIELIEEVGNEGTIPPAQMLKVAPKVKVGVVCGVIVTVNVVVVAHCPASGVKVYVPLFVLSTIVGDHVPVIELLEVAGNMGTTPPEQILKVVPKENVGVTFGMLSFTATQNC
jgi:hypothetical protein